MMTRRNVSGASSGQSFGASRLISAGGFASGAATGFAGEFVEDFPMEHTAEVDRVGVASNREINFANTEELQDEHPVAEIVKHEDQVVVMLERLNLHPGNSLHVLLWLVRVEPCNLVFHEPG